MEVNEVVFLYGVNRINVTSSSYNSTCMLIPYKYCIYGKINGKFEVLVSIFSLTLKNIPRWRELNEPSFERGAHESWLLGSSLRGTGFTFTVEYFKK